MPFALSNSYHALGSAFFQNILPTPVVKPELLLWNTTLANQLGLSELAISENSAQDNKRLAQYFSGNQLIEGSKPIAQAYSGHQFGQFNPQLGDGRAHLLGDVTDTNGKAWDIQLKGSGVSHFSRQGDGRCALGPALREFMMSEAMFALGVPTTRCLAVVATGEAVYRERALPGAVVTRVASSHIRVGTFQYFSARKDTESLKKLTVYAIERHFPELIQKNVADTEQLEKSLSAEQVIDFFSAVLTKQLTLVISWLRVGFIHGVMNTDNTAISGETIDYGPCAMMNHYHNDTVFSSIDRNARYAFGNQASIMQWNMARFAECLIPVIEQCLAQSSEEQLADNIDQHESASENEEHSVAIALLEPVLAQFSQNFKQAYLQMMAQKLGIDEVEEADVALINDLQDLMQGNALDYTKTFVDLHANLTETAVKALADQINNKADNPEDQLTVWQLWLDRWYTRVSKNIPAAKALMAKTNPLVIPRNHHVEAILASSQETGNLTDLQQLLSVLRQPYVNLANTKDYQDSPADGDMNYHTFCGT